MKENPWKKLFKGEEFMINGHDYKLYNVSVDYSDDKKTIKHFTVNFRPVRATDESGDIVFEIPMSATLLFLKYGISLKGTFGDMFEKLEKFQDKIMEKSEKIPEAFSSAIKVFKEVLDKKQS